MRKSFFFFVAILITALSINNAAWAQQYKFRQVNTMMGMKSESTVYVKGMRKRTEGSGMMGIGANLITIEQCDLQRTIRINDKKKLYYIDPFVKETEEVIDEDAKPATALKNKPVPVTSNQPKEKTTQKTGGIVYTWYSITDTGERKKVYGFTARHVWTFQKMKPTPDACTMKDSMIVKTDGWYIDLPHFNCPVQNRPVNTMMPAERQQPECKDSFVNRRSGKGKLGFPLSETRTIITGNATAKTSETETSIETLELTTEKLDSMLFEIPPGYKEAKSEDELKDKFNMNEMVNQYKNMNKDNGEVKTNNEQKKAGMIRIGVYEPKGDEQLQASELQKYLVTILTDGSIEAVAVVSEEEAKKLNCDYTLASDFLKIKQAGKIGGLLKAIKNADPNAASNYNIEAALTLIKLSDGSTRLQPKVEGRFEGRIDDVAKKALDEGSRQVLKALK